MITEEKLVRIVTAVVEAVRAEMPATPPPPLPSTPPAYLSVADFATRLALSKRAVRAMIKAGMPCRRPRPRTLRVPVAAAETWIEQQAQPSTEVDVEAARRRATLDARRDEVH